MGGRFALLIGVTGIIYGGILFRLYDVQVVNRTVYAQKAEVQIQATHPRAALRGSIFFTGKEGNLVPAAYKKEFPEVYAVPNVIEDILEATHSVAPVIGVREEEIQEKLSKTNLHYTSLARKVSEETQKEVETLEMKGIETHTVPARFYQFESRAAHVLGFVGSNAEEEGEKGRYGVERQHETTL